MVRKDESNTFSYLCDLSIEFINMKSYLITLDNIFQGPKGPSGQPMV